MSVIRALNEDLENFDSDEISMLKRMGFEFTTTPGGITYMAWKEWFDRIDAFANRVPRGEENSKISRGYKQFNFSISKYDSGFCFVALYNDSLAYRVGAEFNGNRWVVSNGGDDIEIRPRNLKAAIDKALSPAALKDLAKQIDAYVRNDLRRMDWFPADYTSYPLFK